MEYWSFAVILATFLGPAFAIQVQKSIERNRARSQDKEAVFRMLMSTRATRLSEEHVRALNTIDLAYRGGLPRKRSRGETEVINRWTEYRGHLFIDQRDLTDSQKERWVSDADSGFSSLLEAMAKERGYVFDKHSLGRGGYSPMAHGYMQVQQEQVRHLLLQILSGERPIPMSLRDLPDTSQWNEAVLHELQTIRENTSSKAP
ncbi:DUF6680 family protein [Alcaligenes faecalis]|uniref:DUF6680 family protein n=1 Tax=Alcaligenes faecalis TaxID=511 RepID=UPI00365A82BF